MYRSQSFCRAISRSTFWNVFCARVTFQCTIHASRPWHDSCIALTKRVSLDADARLRDFVCTDDCFAAFTVAGQMTGFCVPVFQRLHEAVHAGALCLASTRKCGIVVSIICCQQVNDESVSNKPILNGRWAVVASFDHLFIYFLISQYCRPFSGPMQEWVEKNKIKHLYTAILPKQGNKYCHIQMTRNMNIMQ